MIVLDTNVISELWKAEPNPQVVTWVDEQAIETLYLSAITVAELRYGLAATPQGKRRSLFIQRLNQEVLPLFAGRVLPFDLPASEAYATLMAHARASGQPIGLADGYIAATALVHNFSVVSRDTRPFQAAGVRVIDPWQP